MGADERTDVVLTHADRIEDAIAEALRHMDLRGLLGGHLVAVKPNDTWASEEDRTAVTQPDTLRGVLEAVRNAAPREVVVSGGAGAAETEEVFALAGLDDVARALGVEIIDHNRPPFTDVLLDYGGDPEVSGPQRAVKVNERVLAYERLVAVNQLKVHRTATVTLALKNIAMSFPAADHYGHPRASEKNQHAFFDDMHSFIAAMAKRFPIHLAVTVGHPAMIGTGPIGGHTFETGLVIASTDAVAADAVGARLLGFSAQAVRHLWESERLGLGETDVDKMNFPALSLEAAARIFSEAAYGKPLTLGTG